MLGPPSWLGLICRLFSPSSPSADRPLLPYQWPFVGAWPHMPCQASHQLPSLSCARLRNNHSHVCRARPVGTTAGGKSRASGSTLASPVWTYISDTEAETDRVRTVLAVDMHSNQGSVNRVQSRVRLDCSICPWGENRQLALALARVLQLRFGRERRVARAPKSGHHSRRPGHCRRCTGAGPA